MPINTDEIIKLVSELSTLEDLQVCVVESAKGACLVGASAFVGSILGGPPGLAIGGMFGSVLAMYRGKGKYRAAADVILYDMTPAQHDQLADSIRTIVADLRPEDTTMLLPIILSNSGIKALVIKEVVNFLSSEMNLQITGS